jgi:hypothetical protein
MIRIHQLPVQDVNPGCSHLGNLFKYTLPGIAQSVFCGTIQPLGIQNHLHKFKLRCLLVLYKHSINKQNSLMSFKHSKCHIAKSSVINATTIALGYILATASSQRASRSCSSITITTADENCYAMTFGGDYSGLYIFPLFLSPST